MTDRRRMTASDVKQQGWRAVMRVVREDGAVVVTNHRQPEAVIVDVDHYESLLQAARQNVDRDEAELDALRHRFDEHLAMLRSADAGERLRRAIREPMRLEGKVKAGSGF